MTCTYHNIILVKFINKITLHSKHLTALTAHNVQSTACPQGRNFTLTGSSSQSSQSFTAGLESTLSPWSEIEANRSISFGSLFLFTNKNLSWLIMIVRLVDKHTLVMLLVDWYCGCVNFHEKYPTCLHDNHVVVTRKYVEVMIKFTRHSFLQKLLWLLQAQGRYNPPVVSVLGCSLAVC